MIEFELVTGCYPCNFYCDCCHGYINRCLKGIDMYSHKVNEITLCEYCYQGTNKGQLSFDKCSSCYEYSHFECDCCEKLFFMKDNQVKGRVKAKNEEESEMVVYGREWEMRTLCENCAYGTSGGISECRHCNK